MVRSTEAIVDTSAMLSTGSRDAPLDFATRLRGLGGLDGTMVFSGLENLARSTTGAASLLT